MIRGQRIVPAGIRLPVPRAEGNSGRGSVLEPMCRVTGANSSRRIALLNWCLYMDQRWLCFRTPGLQALTGNIFSCAFAELSMAYAFLGIEGRCCRFQKFPSFIAPRTDAKFQPLNPSFGDHHPLRIPMYFHVCYGYTIRRSLLSQSMDLPALATIQQQFLCPA